MKNKILFIYSIVLVILLYGVHYFNNATLFFILIGGVSFLVLKPIYIIPVYFISSLSGSFFVAPEGLGSVSRYLSVILILSLLINAIRNKSLGKKSVLNDILIAILIIFNFISSATSITASFSSFFVMLQNLLVLYLFSKFYTKKVDVIFNILFISFLITFGLILLELYFQGFNFYAIQGRLSINEDVNENRFGMMLVQIGVISLLPLFLDKYSKIKKLLSLLTFPIILILIILTGSRTSFLAVLLTVFIVYFFIYKNFNFGKLFIFFLFSFFFFYVWDFLVENIPFMYRFSINTATETGGFENRFYSISLLFKNVIPEHLLFGIGLGGENTLVALHKYGYNLKPAHNIIIDTITQIGLVGFLLYFILFFKIIKKLVKCIKINYIMYMPVLIIIAAFLNGIGETLFFEKFLWNGLALGVFFYNNIKQQNSQEMQELYRINS